MAVAVVFAAIALTLHLRSDPAPQKASQSTSTIESSRLAKATKPSAKPSKNPSAKPNKKNDKKAAITPSSSGRLVIRSLGINATVIPISAPKGVLMPPNNPQTLGWWKDGAAPGAARGSALITGHTVHTGGGALNSLDKASSGEKITFVGGGEKLTYRVQSVKTYHKKNWPKTLHDCSTKAFRAASSSSPARTGPEANI